MASLDDFDPSCYDPDWLGNTYLHRGKVIAHFAFFEKALEWLLASEFSPNRKIQRTMKSVIFDRMSFEQKKTSIRTMLLERGIQEGFVQTKTKRHPYKTLIDELTELNSIRNQFAHYPTVQATNRFEYGSAIGLDENRDNGKMIWFSVEDIEMIIARIAKAQASIYALQKKTPLNT